MLGNEKIARRTIGANGFYYFLLIVKSSICYDLSLYVTMYPYLSLFITMYHYLSLFVTNCQYLSLTTKVMIKQATHGVAVKKNFPKGNRKPGSE